MMNKIAYYIAESFVPYENQAVEQYLLETVADDQVILYLWQNIHTVVIGRNQNSWQECRVAELEADGGHLARRISGGGAVFHDLGNLNFTFAAPDDLYDLTKQLSVIIQALRNLGISAELSGRNDICVDGRKISGNAFFSSEGKSLHHGTVMVGVDISSLSRYLNVDKEKLAAKGVKSVVSRVANLQHFNPEINVDILSQALVAAFAQVYGFEPNRLTTQQMDSCRIAQLREKFASWEWRFGRPLKFSGSCEQRFTWGGYQLAFQADSGKIEQAVLYTDAMDEKISDLVSNALVGCRFDYAAINGALSDIDADSAAQTEIITDICTSVCGRLFTEEENG